MDGWKEYQFEVNGFPVRAKYSTDTVKKIFIPLLQELTLKQKREGRRILVLLAAPPAVGKTTLSQFLAYLSENTEGLTPVQALGMDGFHYTAEYIACHEVVRDGQKVPMQKVKGCPESFDTKKLGDKLKRVRTDDILWPVYDRNIHDVREDQIEVTGRIILVEGNYFLLDENPWRSFAEMADCRIMIRAGEEMLHSRLVQRKMQGGLSKEEAEAFYNNSDRLNVSRVLHNSKSGDLNLIMSDNNDYRIDKSESSCRFRASCAMPKHLFKE